MSEASELHGELARRNQQIAEEKQRHDAWVTPLKHQRRNILMTLAFLYHGVRPGARVVYKGKVYEVKNVNVDLCWSGGGEERMKSKKPWVSGRRVRKDGGLTHTEFNLYEEWELFR